MKNAVRQNVLNVKRYVPGKPIEDVQRELGLKRVIKLASNENCFGPSPKALAAVRKASTRLHRYPDTAAFYLKNRLARKLRVPPEMIMLGNGSDDVIVTAARTFLNEGEQVVIATPTFLFYEIVSQLANARAEIIPLTKDFRYDLDAMRKAVTPRTKMVFIANPDNPTGSYVTRKELDRFVRDVPEDVVILLDEAYFEFAKDAFGDYPDGMKYLDRPNIIVSRSFSKIYGLAGLRVGYAVSNPQMIGAMDRVRDPFNVNLLAQAGALAALDDEAFLKKTLKHVRKEKATLCRAFDRMGLPYTRSATNFIMVDVKKDGTTVFNDLLKKGVIVRHMKAWGLDTRIRVTVGTAEEDRMFLKALKEVL